MVRLNSLEVDAALEVEGVWTERRRAGYRLKVAYLSNPRYEAHIRRAARLTPELADPDADAAMDVVAEALARFVLLDWDGFEGDDGAPMAYTPEIGQRVLASPGFRWLRDDVIAESSRIERYRRERLQADAGKSETPSPGSANGAAS
jgi:hypothetical protein